MQNLKPTVAAKLKGDATLTNLLGGQRVHFQSPPKDAEFPCITYYELDNRDGIMADDQAWTDDIVLSIDVWNKRTTTSPGSTSEIARRVDVLMKELGFKRDFAADLEEVYGTEIIYHKVMRYKIMAQN